MSPLFLAENPGDTLEAVRARRRGKHRAKMVADMVQRGVLSSGSVTDADMMALVAGVSCVWLCCEYWSARRPEQISRNLVCAQTRLQEI